MSEMSLFLRRSARLFPACMGAFAGGFVSDYRRAMLLRLFRALGMRDIELRLPVCGVSDLIRDDECGVSLRELDGVNGNVSALELATLCKLVADRKPETMFEIGTFDGRTALNLAANGGEGSRVFTLDLPREGLGDTEYVIAEGDRQYVEKDGSGARFVGSDVEGRITQLYGDSASFDFGPYEGGVDLVFVDGAHSYDYVMSDSDRALRMLRGGKGVVVWHDYDSWPDVTRALHELAERPEYAGMRRIEGTTMVILER